MEKHFKAEGIINLLIDEGIKKNEKYTEFVNRFLIDKRVNIDVILMLYSKYYIKNKHIIDATNSIDKRDVIVSFIEKNYRNKEKLWSAFYGNNSLVMELVTSYIKNGEINEGDIEIIYCMRKEHLVKALDEDFNIVGIDFINNIIRKEIRTHFHNEGRIGNIKVMQADNLMNASPLWISMMLSQSYTLAKTTTHSDNYTDTIEHCTFDELVNLFRCDFNFYVITIGYFETVNNLSIQQYINMFDTLEKYEFGVETLKKINPLYIFDKTSVEAKRKNLKI